MGGSLRKLGRWTIGLGMITTCLTAAAEPLSAQLIPIRTVPVASGDQYRLVPSARMGMGSTRFAVDDSLADGWSHPARGAARAPRCEPRVRWCARGSRAWRRRASARRC